MKLSILDQALVSSGKTPNEALNEAMNLAQWGEKLGYTRYWIAEHHDINGFSCPAPEVMLGYIGAHTDKIRIGSGATLLPHYKPYKVAETFNLLATLFPDRIDLGIGRAPGGSAEATMALSDNYLEQVRQMPKKITDLLHFLDNDYPQAHMFSKIKASPLPDCPPQPWILGTSEKSAVMAADQGTAYAFGQFMSSKDGREIIKTYKNSFTPSKRLAEPQALLTVSVLCAETDEQAEELAQSLFLWNTLLAKGEGESGIPTLETARQYPYTEEEEKKIHEMRDKVIMGNPQHVKQKLKELQAIYQVDELMIISITHNFEARKRSYELIANECLL